MSILKNIFRDNLLKNISWTFLSNFTIGLISFISIIYFNSILSLNEISKYAIISSTLEISWAFINLGLNQYLIIKSNNKVALINIINLFYLQSLILIIISFICVLFFFNFNIFTLVSIFLLTIGKCLENASTILYADDESNLNYKKISIYRSVSKVLGIFIAFLFSLLVKNYSIFIFRDFLTNLILFIFYFEKRKFYTKLIFNKKELKNILNFIYKIYALNLFERVTSKVDVLIIKSLWGQEFVGQYFSIKNIFDGILGFLLFPIQTVLYGFYCKNKYENIFIFKKIKRVTVPIVCLLIAILILSSSSIVESSKFTKGFNTNVYIISGLFIYTISILLFENIKVYFISQNISFIGVTSRILQLLVQVFIYYFILQNGINNSNFTLLISLPFLLLIISTLIIATYRIQRKHV